MPGYGSTSGGGRRFRFPARGLFEPGPHSPHDASFGHVRRSQRCAILTSHSTLKPLNFLYAIIKDTTLYVPIYACGGCERVARARVPTRGTL